jgi:hypothetical protein
MATYKPIQSIVLSTSASSVTFSNIPQDYTDLVIVCNIIRTAASDVEFQLNGDTTNNYSSTILFGDGSSEGSVRSSSDDAANAGYSASTNPMTMIMQLQNYSNLTTFKTALIRNSPAVNSVSAIVSLYRSTSAITSIRLFPSSGNFNTGSTFDLYGIKSGAPSALGGDVVTTDGNYWYHTFNTTQTFTTLKPLTVDYLVVAGGGGGGFLGGGGGGGGFRTNTAFSLSGSFTVTVGGGGTGGVSPTSPTGGNNSVLSTITSAGGGQGGIFDGEPGVSGGSGGGAGADSGAPAAVGGTGNTPSASPAQGTNGGNAFVGGSGSGSGGGGGGATAAGSTGTSGKGGNGGNGTSNSYSGSAVTYAGGGGGGAWAGSAASTGGTGGGGAGTQNATAGTAGTTNLGGGGGAGGFLSVYGNGGNGGSGVVIVRYPV